jgi:hypothetical protein
VDTKKKFTINGKESGITSPVNLKLISSTAKVLLKDDNGEILLSENEYEKGSVFFFNAPLEEFYTESYMPENTALYEVYKLFMKDRKTEFSIESSRCMITVHELENGKMGVMINNYEDQDVLTYELQDGYKIDKILYAEANGNKLQMQRKYAYLELVKKN